MNILDKLMAMNMAKYMGKCPRCGKATKDEVYKDEASQKESKITGYCQKCMDFVFDELFKEEE